VWAYASKTLLAGAKREQDSHLAEVHERGVRLLAKGEGVFLFS